MTRLRFGRKKIRGSLPCRCTTY